MSNDPYTKLVLTIIALCLVVLCVQGLTAGNPAYAQGAPAVTNVRIVAIGEDGATQKVPNKTILNQGMLPVASR